MGFVLTFRCQIQYGASRRSGISGALAFVMENGFEWARVALGFRPRASSDIPEHSDTQAGLSLEPSWPL